MNFKVIWSFCSGFLKGLGRKPLAGADSKGIKPNLKLDQMMRRLQL